LLAALLREIPSARFQPTLCVRLRDALAQLKSSHFQIILSDLSLPDSRGLETFRTLHAASPEIPIVVLSGNDDEELALKAVREGAQDYLVKNLVNYTMLARSIRYSIERKQSLLEKDRLIEQLRDALAKVKTLTGLLPICAACKQIRDDKGYWQQVETYLQQHTSAVFTHSICPRCARRLYPGADKPKPG